MIDDGNNIESARIGLSNSGPLANAVLYNNGKAAWDALAAAGAPISPIICTYSTRPASPAIGQSIYQTDTGEYLHWVYGPDGNPRWMQANPPADRNVIINGTFDFWQRGSSNISGNNYRADRFYAVTNSSYGLSSSVPTSNLLTPQFRYSARHYYSSTATSYLRYRIESIDAYKFANKYMTISFWARKNTSGSGNGVLYVEGYIPGSDNNYGSSSYFGGNYSDSWVPTDSWQYWTLTLLCPSTSTRGIELRFSRYSAAANDTLWTGIQAELGTAPSAFEYVNFDTMFNRCQRYYQTRRAYVGAIWDNDYNINGAGTDFPVEMRTTPSVTILNGQLDGHHGTAPSVYSRNNESMSVRWTGGAVRNYGATGFFTYTADAEI